MTDKRFKIFTGKHYGVQAADGEVILDSIISFGEADVLVDWLNELYEENEQLKQRLQSILKLIKKIEDCTYDMKLIGDVE